MFCLWQEIEEHGKNLSSNPFPSVIVLHSPESSQKQVKRGAQAAKGEGAEMTDIESRRQFVYGRVHHTCLAQNVDGALREMKQSFESHGQRNGWMEEIPKCRQRVESSRARPRA